MKRNIFSIAIFLGFSLFLHSLGASELKESVVYRAMKEELERTMKRLKMEKMERPYYLSYRVEDYEFVEMGAHFGTIHSDQTQKMRFLSIDLRVGDYTLDNTHFVPEVFGFSSGFGGGMVHELPIQDDYDALRQEIWLITDSAYKGALEEFSKKKAAIENRVLEERQDDFSRVKPTVHIEPEAKLSLEREEWRKRVKSLSEVFREYPRIQTSKVIFSATAVTQYFIDSEGSSHRRGDGLVALEAEARTQADNGDPLADFVGFYRTRPEELPNISIITKAIRAMADSLTLLTTVEKGETYSGPVLFMGQAAGELFYQILGRGVSDPRGPLYENPMMEGMEEKKRGFLAKKVGRPILPSEFSVYDDPTLESWGDTPLIGHYSVDDEGVKAQKASLVERGKLTGLLMSRIPTKEMKESNGHGRSSGEGIVGQMGNLIVQTEKGLDEASLIEEFLDLCKEMGLEYGIVVSKLRTPISKSEREEMMEMFLSYQGGARKKTLLSAPIRAYKLYPDGKRLETVRSLEFGGVTERIMKDIVASGREEVVYNFLDEGLQTSVVAPPVVIEEMELVPEEVKPTKLPILPHPYFGKR